MYGFILVLRLYAGGPIVEVPVNNCAAGVVWIHEAWRWTERTGMPDTGPMYVCFPAEVHMEVARR